MLHLSRRFLAFAILCADLWRASATPHLVWVVLLCDGVALVLIVFAAQIDEFTFGTSGRGYTINARTPPFLIAGFGWVLLIGFSTLLFLGGLDRAAGP
jgi:hypothetical protein